MADQVNTLSALLAPAATDDAPALIHDGRSYSYRWLADRSAAVAGGLAALGIGRGDKLALWLPNCPDWFALFLACARLGAVAIAVNTRYRSADVGDILARSGAQWLALWPGFKGIDFPALLADVRDQDLAALQGVITVGADADSAVFPDHLIRQPMAALHQAPPTPPIVEDRGRAQDGVAVFTTSGTTRAPKFVLHSQSGIVRHAADAATALGYTKPDAVLLQMLPFCGVFGFCQAMACLAAGRPMVLMSSFDAAQAVDLIRQHRVTDMNGADDMFRAILAAVDGVPFTSLRRCGFAAFNSDPEALVQQGARLGMPLSGLYGMSELQALFAAQPPDASLAVRTQAGGVPVSPAARVRVRDPDSGALLAAGQPGLLEITGPSQMIGYMGDAAATRAAITDDGYVRTGDLGYVRDDGGFVFLARQGDSLRLGGFLVSPAEIAAHIEALDAVDQCQIVGAHQGEKPVAVAFVICRADPVNAAITDESAITADEILDHCRAGLARYKVPAAIHFVTAFPTADSANGAKIQRTLLRDRAQKALDQAG